MLRKNKTEFLVLKCLALENKVQNLEEKIKVLEDRMDKSDEFRIYSPQEFLLKGLPTPESTDIKEFHLDMRKIKSYDLME